MVQRQTGEEKKEEELIQPKPLIEQITPLVQRQVEPEEEEEEEIVQAKESASQAPEVTPGLESRIQSLKGGGQPLPESVRAFFEPFFGYDFSQVRVHNDTQAAESTKAINARAFTLGKDVVFGAGQYAPETSSGKRLLAHELTHVVQQADEVPTGIQREETEPRQIGTAPSSMLGYPPVEKPVPKIPPKETITFFEWWWHGGYDCFRQCKKLITKYPLRLIKEPVHLKIRVELEKKWFESEKPDEIPGEFWDAPIDNVRFRIGPVSPIGSKTSPFQWRETKPQNLDKVCKEVVEFLESCAQILGIELKLPAWVNEGAKKFIIDWIWEPGGPYSAQKGNQLVWVKGDQAQIQMLYPQEKEKYAEKGKNMGFTEKQIELVTYTYLKWNEEMKHFVLEKRVKPSSARALIAEIDKECLKQMLFYVACAAIGP
jgi:hypothetical protein